jgi:hypothetical protein
MILVEPEQQPPVPGDPGICVWAPTVFPTTREVFLPLSLDSSLVIRTSKTPAYLDVSICSRCFTVRFVPTLPSAVSYTGSEVDRRPGREGHLRPHRQGHARHR